MCMVSERKKKRPRRIYGSVWLPAQTEHETMTVLSSHVCNPFACAYVLSIKCCWPEHLTESYCMGRRTWNYIQKDAECRWVVWGTLSINNKYVQTKKDNRFAKNKNRKIIKTGRESVILLFLVFLHIFISDLSNKYAKNAICAPSAHHVASMVRSTISNKATTKKWTK